MRTISAHDFLPRSAAQALGADEIHVWLFPEWPNAKDSADSSRVRRWLADYEGRDAADLRIERGAEGKPFLADSTLRFNLSHSRGALALAIARDLDIGIDIENADRPRRALDLAERWFHPSEVATLAALDGPARAAAFIHLWCCKEALLKATGSGIANGLSRAVFRLDDAGRVSGFGEGNAIDDYRFVQLEPAAGLIGALAWRGGEKRVKVFRYAQ
ncbi:MAG: 4'-phosphopantetheinyl transferase superfamily protein [Rudaea sp.]